MPPRARPRAIGSASRRGSSPSSASCISVRDAPASGCSVPWNMFNIMNPIAAARAALPNSGAKVGPSTWARSCCSVSGPEHPQPDDGQEHEVHGGHGAAGQHGSRHVALRVDRLADVAGRRLEGRRREADQVQARPWRW